MAVFKHWQSLQPRVSSSSEDRADVVVQIKLPEFFDHAVCPTVDQDGFFPEKGATTTAAKQVCAGCPVRRECLEYALENREEWGVWGGTSAMERKKMWRRQDRVAS